MSKAHLLVDGVILIVLSYYVTIVWTADIPLAPQDIIAVLDGVVSSVSLIVGFNITVIAVMLSTSKFTPSSARIGFTAVTLVASIGMVLLGYLELTIYAHYVTALKYSMIGFVVSFGTIGDLAVYFHSKLVELKHAPSHYRQQKK